MSNTFSGDKRKKEWCMVYVNKYVLRIGTWLQINNKIENCPYPWKDEYRMLHISVCNDLQFVWPKPSKYEKDTETH